MKLPDLILLLECADSDNCGDEPVRAGIGFIAAKNRLLDAGLVEENPNEEGAIRIKMRGLAFVDKLLEIEP